MLLILSHSGSRNQKLIEICNSVCKYISQVPIVIYLITFFLFLQTLWLLSFSKFNYQMASELYRIQNLKKFRLRQACSMLSLDGNDIDCVNQLISVDVVIFS